MGTERKEILYIAVETYHHFVNYFIPKNLFAKAFFKNCKAFYFFQFYISLFINFRVEIILITRIFKFFFSAFTGDMW